MDLKSRSAVARSSACPNSQNASAASEAPCQSASSASGLRGKRREMSSKAPASVRARCSRGVACAPAFRVSMSWRSPASRVSSSFNSRVAFEGCADTLAAMARTTMALAQLRIHLLEVAAVDQHLAWLAAAARGDEPFGFHHVHEARCAAETDAELPLQMRNGGLAAADDDARRLVVEVVLLEFESAHPALLILGRDGVVEDRLALLAQEAGEPRALLFGDVGAVKPDAA